MMGCATHTNMNMKAVENKVKAAIAAAQEGK
jgi:hypothetical protein